MKYKDIDLHKVEELVKTFYPDVFFHEWNFTQELGLRLFFRMKELHISRWVTVKQEHSEKDIVMNVKEAIIEGLKSQISSNNTMNKALQNYLDALEKP